MKKILIFAACVASLVACNEAQKPAQLYCEKEVSRLYNDPSAEMDTLSYAAGMNLGLVVSLQNSDFDIDAESLIAVLDREFKSDATDEEAMKKHNEFLGEFSNERVRPFMMAKQMNARVVTDCPDTLSLPEIYDETYTKERFIESFGAMMANSVRQQRIPANKHWMYAAIRDAEGVKSKEEIDNVMLITESKFFEVMSGYVQRELAEYNAELTNNWFKRVAEKENVKELMNEKGEPMGVYYRVNNAGGDVKPVNATDSIAVKYAVYSRTGKLLESNQMFIDNLKKQREQMEGNKMMPDSLRQVYIKQIDQEIAKSEVRQLPLNRFMQKDVQDALKFVGAGGSVTVWLDAAKAFGFRASRIVPVNEGVVVNVELLDLKTIAPAPMPVTNSIARPIDTNAKGGHSAKVVPQGNASKKTPMVVPVQKKQ